VAALAPYVPGQQPQEPGWIKLNTNEHPHVLPQVLAAIRAAVTEAVRLYPDPLCTAVRARLSQRYGVPPEQIICGNGSDELLGLLMRASVGEGDRVVFPSPTYSLYRTLAEIQNATPVAVELGADFSLPVAALCAAGGKLTFVAHPNAPTGRPVPREQFAALCAGLDGIVVADEAYVDFGAQSALPLLERYPNLVVVRTLSKGFALAGLRFGYAFGSPELIGGLYKVKDSYNVNRLTQAAALAALEHYEEAMAANREVAARRDRVMAQLQEQFGGRGWQVYPSQANFFLVDTGHDPARWVYKELQRQRILVRYFQQPRLEHCLRISVGSEAEMAALVAALGRLFA